MTKQTSILIIDDDVYLDKLLEHTLEYDGWQVHIARDGTEGERMFDTEHPDMVILDLGLPDIDGFEVCRTLRQRSQQVPIMILSGRTEQADKIKGLTMGADAYLTKPFDSDELTARAKALLRRAKPDDPNDSGQGSAS